MATSADLGEFGLIARITAGLAQPSDVVLGVGDDAAILDISNAEALVATCDAQVEGVHFRLRSSRPDAIGRRALAVNMSDIAAMGAQPRFALISLLTPPSLSVAIIDDIYAGLRAEATTYGVAIVGGNVARNPERLILDITLLGTGRRDSLLRRSGAQPGDALLVTGSLGTAAAGLLLMEHADLADTVPAATRAAVIAAQQTPTPRVAAGQWLAQHGATAALDVSDGLAADARHLCDASGVGARIDADALPITTATSIVAHLTDKDAGDLALFGGEDYELLFTAPAGRAEEITRQIYAATGTPATRIGMITAEPGVLLTRHGQTVALPSTGWDHLI